MYQLMIVVHVLLGVGIIGLVLMQQGKGADAGAAFGSGTSGSVFGAQGAASFLSRTTAILATLFFTTSLGLAVVNGQQSKAAKADDLMTTPDVQQKAADVPLNSTPAVVPSSLSAPPASDLPPNHSEVNAQPSVALPAVIDTHSSTTDNGLPPPALADKPVETKSPEFQAIKEKTEAAHDKASKTEAHSKHEHKSEDKASDSASEHHDKHDKKHQHEHDVDKKHDTDKKHDADKKHDDKKHSTKHSDQDEEKPHKKSHKDESE
ncbi:MAG: hypothetical protein RL637_201 [Pseudomonadota bacterium]